MTKDEYMALYEAAVAWKAVQKAHRQPPQAPEGPELSPLEPHDRICWRCGGTGLLKPYTRNFICHVCQGSGRAAEPVNPP